LLDRAASLKRPRVVLIGAGFIGFIMLNAMSKRGWTLSVVERESHVLPRMLSVGAAGMVHTWLKSRGVAIHCDRTVQRFEPLAGDAIQVILSGNEAIDADLVVVATGIRPNLDLIRDTDIAVDQGVLVDDRMQTSAEGVYAGGDVAQGPDLLGDRPVIHAIQPTAVDHGRVAGANMAGRETHYPGSLLMNILDICGLQCASFGCWDDPSAEAMTIANPDRPLLRQLLWQGDQVTGAIFLGPADDLGMLTDVGMVKGIIQTRTRLGTWKDYLAENPFDIRRAFVAAKVAQRLAGTTLLGTASAPRRYRFRGEPAIAAIGPSHKVFVREANID
jgi:NAD(P)H-nitrite reductase large subunit